VTCAAQAAVSRHLVRRGLVAPGAALVVEPLGGGVSGDVVGVAAGERAMVVKRPLARLRVEQEWHADVGRIVTEARALRVAGALAPGAAPEVLDLDEREHVLVMARAPESWTPWRDSLLAGRVDDPVGRRLGSLLATWHLRTARHLPERSAFASTAAFEELRIDPFHRAVAARHPELAGHVHAVVDRLLTTKSCLVHGDFSPKNVLADPAGTGLWVLDWEVAHLGDPSFDLAFMLTHLLLKAVHRPDDRHRYRATASAFLEGYAAGAGADGLPGSRRLAADVGCLLLARVDGKSPAGYLTAPQRERARALGAGLLLEPPADVRAVWEQAA
jgi:5-methylthioribose kinase